MKKILLGLALIMLSVFVKAQNGLENIIVEKYYISTAADSIGSSGNLPVGSVTYRIYADMLPGYKFQMAYGNANHNLKITTTTSFFNNEDYGSTTPDFSKTNAAKNTVMLDSWLSVGAACNGNFGVLKSEDDSLNNVVNLNGLLTNTDHRLGIPLTVQDGFLAGTPQSVQMVGITTQADVFGDGSANGNSFILNNAAWSSLNGSTGPTSTNRVLIAQITTNGEFHYELNIQIGTPTGGAQNYVSSNPVMYNGQMERTIPSLTGTFNSPPRTTNQLQFVYTSDAHYGITRARFQKVANVNATVVNAAMIAKMNNLTTLTFPNDGGVNAGNKVDSIDYVMMTGDIANRSEVSLASNQSAATSWTQFSNNYINGITLKNKAENNAGLYLLPGNHDVSNAIGYYKVMSPLTDSSVMVNIYNSMMPSPRPAGNYNYANEKIHYSKNIGGIHLMFVCMWPDSTERIWMANDLASVSSSTPVFIFTHDQPSVESKHFTNPFGSHNINSVDKFENLLSESFKDGNVNAASTLEQRGFASFLHDHPNICVYFHGNDNQNNYYKYYGPDNNVSIDVVQVDSPMKGNISATDETKLSFQLVTVDTIARRLTVRECLWDTDTNNVNAPIVFGTSKTINYDVNVYALQRRIDSVNTLIAGLVASNFTVPSWTKYLRALTTYNNTTKNDTTINNLLAVISNMKSASQPYNIVMTLNKDPQTKMAFNWFTNAGITGGKVQILVGNITDSSAFATPLMEVTARCDSAKNLNYSNSSNGLFALTGIADNSKKTYMFNKALAVGLTPNTQYSFRVGKNGAWSSIGTFTTAKATKEPFSFVYTTDPQANTDAMFNISQTTTHAAQAMYPNANFWLHCGDLVESSGTSNSEWEYEQFFETQQDIFMKNPFTPVEGNHDISTNKNFTYHFNTDSTAFDYAKATVPGSLYSYVYGDALFMGMTYENYSTAGYLDSLANWMSKQVQAHPEVKWRLAFYHKTMYTGSSSHQSDADGRTVREKMGPVFDSLKIDLAFQGHDHVYEVIGPVKAGNLIPNEVFSQTSVAPTVRDNLTGKLGGTFDVQQGTMYFLNNSAGKKKYEPRTAAQMNAAFAQTGVNNYFNLFSGRFGQNGLPTFSNVTVSTDTLSITTYSVDSLGGTTLFDAFKIVKSVPAPTGPSTQTYCSSDNKTISDLMGTLSGSAIRVYNVATGGSVLNPASLLTNGTTYYATQTVGGIESINRLAIAVTINTTVTPSVSIYADNLTICSGTAVNFTAYPTNGGTTPSYDWYVDGVLQSGHLATLQISPIANTSVYCKMTSNAPCTTTNPVTSNTRNITISPIPSVSIVADNLAVCSGATIHFTATPTNGGSSPTYNWYRDGALLFGGTSASANIMVTAVSNVYCKMISSAGCSANGVQSNTLTNSINPLVTPTIAIVADNQTVCSGNAINLTATTSNGGLSPVYDWYVGGVLQAVHLSTLQISPNASTNVYCKLTSNASCITTTTVQSNTINLNVNPSSVASVSIIASSLSVCTGSAISYTATPTNGGTSPIYNWYRGGVLVTGGASATISLGTSTSSNVYCKMTSNLNCVSTNPVTSNTVNYTVTSPATPSVTIAASANPVNSGTTVTFTTTPQVGYTIASTTWYKNAINVATTPSYSYLPTSGDQVYAKIQFNEACTYANASNTITMTVNVLSLPAVSTYGISNNIYTGVTFNGSVDNTGGDPNVER
ncbi:MAG: metallophosphoesterase [Bacteroidota bacterium]